METCVDNPTTTDMWQRYAQFRDQESRDELILHYLPLVRRTASRMAADVAGRAESADLTNYGVFGLVDAIEKFEPDRGIKFEAYAMCRIRGAIRDGVRSTDWVPRSVRAKSHNADEAQATLEHTLRRSPTKAEIASEMGISIKDLNGLARQKSVACVLRLDRNDGENQSSLGELLADDTAGPGAGLEVAEMSRILSGAVDRLGDRERDVVRLYYFEGLNLAAIGKRLNVTESRICQIRGSALSRLRTRLARTLAESA